MTPPIDFERIILEETEPARALARYILQAWAPSSVLDVGCGPGIYAEAIQNLASHPIVVRGVDSDPRAPAWVVPTDITVAHAPGVFDLVLCLEVLEHIPALRSRRALRYLIGAQPSTLLFSAAIPGQGGEGHVHLQPRSYWVRRFHTHGYYLDIDRTEAMLAHIRTGPHMGWFTQNAMVLSPARGQE